MTRFDALKESLLQRRRVWLVTGAAGFIGSHLTATLLQLGQRVRGLDNFATGRKSNLEDIRQVVGEKAWGRLEFIEGDIRDLGTCMKSTRGVDAVLHQAALGSVPRSIQNPIASHQANVDGFLHMLWAAKEGGIQNVVFASSSSVYGDDPRLPKVETQIGRPLSPYALTKSIDEQYARVFEQTYGLRSFGLRYFNVFGPRQNPNGPYAAVIPRWIRALERGDPCAIFGDGETSRDFCFVGNAVQANLLAASLPPEVEGGILNVSCGGKTSLNDLYGFIRDRIALARPDVARLEAVHQPPRPGDIRDSQADLTRTRALLGYCPTHSVIQGLDETVPWFLSHPEPDA